MTYQHAIDGAKQVCKEHRAYMAVVNAPVENAEDASGPYGYCPLASVPRLFAKGKVEAKVLPTPAGNPYIVPLPA